MIFFDDSARCATIDRAPESDHADNVPLRIPTVLVVDDDPILRLVACSVLQRAGYIVVPACDGEDALARFGAGLECDLVVTDMHMPRLDGMGLIRHLRGTSSTAALPVLVLSGSDASVLADYAALGANAAIAKPINPASFLACVRATLGESASGSAE